MKKIGLICLALILALGALGAVYASWNDTVTISGPVGTGRVNIQFVGPIYCAEAASLFDLNWTTWVTKATGNDSCPPNGGFDNAGVHVETKEVGYLDPTSVIPIDSDGDTYFDQLQLTVLNGYPYYLIELRVHVENCGTIPVDINILPITQDPSLLIEVFNGDQVEPGVTHEISFYVGVTQHLHNNPLEDLTPQGVPLTFTIGIQGTQWNE